MNFATVKLKICCQFNKKESYMKAYSYIQFDYGINFEVMMMYKMKLTVFSWNLFLTFLRQENGW